MLLSLPLKTSFENISQRMMYGIAIAFADYAPVKSDVPVSAQKDFYDIMKNIFISIYNNPEKIGLPTPQDDYFRAFQCGNQRPKLDKLMKEIALNIKHFYKILYFAGNIGKIDGNMLTLDIKPLKDAKIKIKHEYLIFLTSIGINASSTKEQITIIADNDILKAWQLLAKTTLHTDINDKSHGVNSVDFGLLKFACALYSDDFSYYQHNIEELHNLPKGYFTSYFKDLKKCGFYEDTFGNLFEVEFKIRGKVSGFAIRFSAHRLEQFYFMGENCQGVKAMLADFDSIPLAVQDYLVFSCNKCNNCLGCTKGGKAKVFTMNVKYKGDAVALCPQFNRREWFSVDDKFMGILIEYIKLQEKYGKVK